MKRKLISILLACVLALVILPPAMPVYAASETLRPDATGDYTNLTPVGDTPNWKCVDNVAPDDDTRVIMGGTTEKKDAYNLSASGATGAINSVTVYFRCRAFTTQEEGYTSFFTPYLRIGTDETEGTTRQQTTNGESFTTYDEALARPGGGTWLATDLADLQVCIGLRTAQSSFGQSWCTQIYVVVDYTAATAPAITTDAATYVAKTTARLNSTVDDDGLEPCDVRFGYGTVSKAAVDFEEYDTKTDWVEDTYTTGQYPWVDIDSLVGDTPYYYRAQIKNDSNGAVTSATEIEFTTTSVASAPTNLKAYPASTTVELTWTRGDGAAETMIRYSEGDYPADQTEGTHAYTGTLASFTILGLTAGHTYYIVGIGKSGTSYSGTTEVMATTIAATVAPAMPGAPDEPAGLFQVPDPTQIENFPGYAMFNDIAENLNIPTDTLWMYIILFCIALMGFVFYKISHNLMVVTIVIAVGITWGSLIGILPLWWMFMVVILGLGLFQFQRGRAS